jgi:hypothetical protein
VAFEPSQFERAGELSGRAIYRRSGEPDTIYVEGGEKGVAPFRLRQ